MQSTQDGLHWHELDSQLTKLHSRVPLGGLEAAGLKLEIKGRAGISCSDVDGLAVGLKPWLRTPAALLRRPCAHSGAMRNSNDGQRQVVLEHLGYSRPGWWQVFVLVGEF